MKYVAALSGGVDSSVVAGLLKEAGHDVLGIMLKLAPDRDGAPAARRCCSLDDALDARAVANRLGIPFYVVNAQEEFARHVVEPFVGAYREGRTPIPCVACNTHLKFGRLVQHARALGARLATGHYARVVHGPDGPQLHRPADRDRDQTYFLHAIGLEALGAVDFPLGELRKPAVRAHAARLGLPVVAKPDSQEICFVPDEGHGAFVELWDGKGATPGELVDPAGNLVGHHRGVHTLTVGQRKGLGVRTTDRLYVLQLDARDGRAWVGPETELLARGLVAQDARWLATDAELETLLAGPVQVQVRARHVAAEARVERMGSGFRVAFQEPQRALAPGQSAVVYADTRCLGGGTIQAAWSPLPTGPHNPSVCLDSALTKSHI
ncbi:MAG: tRNA 2-thiouridine(34) synthase MnmA [Deltaproteobacteria bacterium]|nr:tRNA 2-thiouridine(34) synthase MnmA [Deltaproteobacteria bacterium]